MRRRLFSQAAAAALLLPAAAAQAQAPAGRQKAPANASVYFIAPTDHAVVGPNVHVVMGARNFGVAPAGVRVGGTGHHHLLIDTKLPHLDQPIPADDNHLHFGVGQTETVIELPPGKHTLQLLMGDADHVPHDPPVLSRVITITVRSPRAHGA